MTDLRADLIDDMAEVFREAGHDEPFATQYGSVCLMRALDTLADRADEWEMEVDDAYWNAMTSGDFDRIEEFVTRRLVAVLRGDI